MTEKSPHKRGFFDITAKETNTKEAKATVGRKPSFSLQSRTAENRSAERRMRKSVQTKTEMSPFFALSAAENGI